MQLGARWSARDEPHRSVPESLHEMIAAQETAHPDAVSWTLTWLEGRPRCALDDVALVSIDAAGRPILIEQSRDHSASVPGDDDDDWLN